MRFEMQSFGAVVFEGLSGAVRLPPVGLDDQVNGGVCEVDFDAVDLVVDQRSLDVAFPVELEQQVF